MHAAARSQHHHHSTINSNRSNLQSCCLPAIAASPCPAPPTRGPAPCRRGPRGCRSSQTRCPSSGRWTPVASKPKQSDGRQAATGVAGSGRLRHQHPAALACVMCSKFSSFSVRRRWACAPAASSRQAASSTVAARRILRAAGEAAAAGVLRRKQRSDTLSCLICMLHRITAARCRRLAAHLAGERNASRGVLAWRSWLK